MRLLVIGGTGLVGLQVALLAVARGDDVLVVHRGHTPLPDDVRAEELLSDRARLARHSSDVRAFGPDAVLDTCAMTASDVDAVTAALPDVHAVVLSSQDVYQAHAALLEGRCDAAVPLGEDSELRRDRYPYRGRGLANVPDDYSKLDVEDRWLARGATVLRLPMVYGPRDPQRREDFVLRRLRAGREIVPVGAGNLLWTRGDHASVAAAAIAALDRPLTGGRALNIGESRTVTLAAWMEQIIAAAGASARLRRVCDRELPADLVLTAAPAQHLLVCVREAERALDWTARDPATAVAESVRWHLDHPPERDWSAADAAADDRALASSE